MQMPREIGSIDARFCAAAVQGALPRLAVIMKLFPNAFKKIEPTNHNKFPLTIPICFLIILYFFKLLLLMAANKLISPLLLKKKDGRFCNDEITVPSHPFYFTEPAVIPATIFLLKKINKISGGSEINRMFVNNKFH